MIRLCSRFDSVLFTPKMSAIPSYGNYSRFPKFIFRVCLNIVNLDGTPFKHRTASDRTIGPMEWD
jgi:hypothetical protein